MHTNVLQSFKKISMRYVVILGLPLTVFGCKSDLLGPIFPSNTLKNIDNISDPNAIYLGLIDSDSQTDIWFSAPGAVNELEYCWSIDAAAPCPSDQQKKLSSPKEKNERHFFMVETPWEINDSGQLMVTTTDSSGQQKISMHKFLTGGTQPPTPSSYKWRDEISFISIPATSYEGNTYNSPRFADILSHVKKRFWAGDATPLTIAHENVHFLLSEVPAKPGEKFIYYGDGKGAFMREPNVSTLDVQNRIPEEILKQAKHANTYIIGRPSQPVVENIFDEWVAYLNETIVLVETLKNNSNVENDSMEGGATEFLFYAASAMAIAAEKSPEVLQDKNFKAIFAMLAEQTRDVHKDVQALPQIGTTHADRFLTLLQSHSSAESTRKALRNMYGADWTMAVLGL